MCIDNIEKYIVTSGGRAEIENVAKWPILHVFNFNLVALSIYIS